MSREAPGPAGHLRRPARATRAAGCALQRDRRRAARPRRLRAVRDAGLRGHRAVRARGGGVHRHRPEGDVHLRGQGRPLADAAARGHRRRLPRLRRARHAQAAAAGEALVPGARSSATRRRRPAASASSPRSAPRRSAPTTPALDAELILLLAELLERAGARPRTAAPVEPGHARDARAPTSTSCATTCARARPSCRTRCASGSTEPAARVRRRPPGHAGGDGRGAAAARPARRRRRRALRRGARAARRRRAWSTRSTRRSCAGSTTTRARCSSSSRERLGAQAALGGGGRYDRLVEELGGPPTPGRRLGGRDRADPAGGRGRAGARASRVFVALAKPDAAADGLRARAAAARRRACGRRWSRPGAR